MPLRSGNDQYRALNFFKVELRRCAWVVKFWSENPMFVEFFGVCPGSGAFGEGQFVVEGASNGGRKSVSI